MKKSKIIVPALGLLLLSTAASVSGTVAWFTANRTYSNTISAFHVGSVDGALASQATIAPVAGVRENPANSGTIVFETIQNAEQVPSFLADASYDHTSGKMYTDNASYTSEGGSNTSHFIDLGTASEANWYAGSKGGNRYYYGFAWDTTFTYTYGAETTAVDFFVDLSSVGTNFSVANRAGTEGKTAQIEKALRVALICGTEKIVLAPFRSASDHASTALKFANGENPSGEPVHDPLGTYTIASAVNTANADLVTGATITSTNGKFAFEKAVDNTLHTDLSARVDYLGQFALAASSTLTVRIVVWLDGLDGVTVNASDLNDTLSGSMQFYAVSPKAAA